MTLQPHGTSPDSRQRPTVSIAWLYVMSGLVMLFLCISAIVALSITRPQLDVMVVSAVVFAFGTTTYASMCAAIKGQETKHIAKENAYRTNGRLTELLDAIVKQKDTEGTLLARQKELEGILKGAGAAALGSTVIPPAAEPNTDATSTTGVG